MFKGWTANFSRSFPPNRPDKISRSPDRMKAQVSFEHEAASWEERGSEPSVDHLHSDPAPFSLRLPPTPDSKDPKRLIIWHVVCLFMKLYPKK